MVASVDVVNRALELAVRNVQVTGVNPTFDGTAAGNAAGVLYTPAVQLLLRQMNPAFARLTATLAASGGIGQAGWVYSYTYPADSLRIRQLRPLAGGYNVNDPQPVRGTLYYDSGLAAKCIAANLNPLAAVYTSSLPSENQWDWAFLEVVARRLSSPLAMALAGRPDFARELLDESERMAQDAELSDEM